jgi:hypothetical protein
MVCSFCGLKSAKMVCSDCASTLQGMVSDSDSLLIEGASIQEGQEVSVGSQWSEDEALESLLGMDAYHTSNRED